MGAYIHGAYGQVGETISNGVAEALTTPCYVGTAPVNLIRGYDADSVINTPVYLSDMADVKKKLGYSESWEDFTLSEVASAHFENANGNIGPIYVINVLDPSKHKSTDTVTIPLTFKNGTATFKTGDAVTVGEQEDTLDDASKVIFDTFTLANHSSTEFDLSYNALTKTVKVSSTGTPITGTVNATFNVVDVSEVTTAEIIGGVTDAGVYTGLHAAELLYPKYNAIANLYCIPKYDANTDVHQELVNFVQAVNKHWYAMAFVDIPLSSADTITDAISAKATLNMTSMYEKVFWPMVKTASGKVYHLSVLSLVEQIRVDNSHDGVPMESVSNKGLPVAVQYFGAESANQGFDQASGNVLNAAGITTAVAWGGQYVAWGPHTGAFVADESTGNANASVDPMAIFDVNVRVQEYILNSFQQRWGEVVDSPMNRGLAESILNEEQSNLDALVSIGALIGNPVVTFTESENSDSDLINGNFTWSFADTPTPPAKSLTAKVSYTDAGFETFFAEGGEE
jgi:phage tail sheath protein FI